MDTPDGPATEEFLRRAGLRSTAPRRAVLRVLGEHPHQTVMGIAELLGANGTTMSRQSLHNVLDDLSRTCVVRSIQPTGSATRYETDTGDDHHHLVCRRCGAVVDVARARPGPACPAPTPDFPVVDGADVTWWGLCATCLATTASRPHPAGSPREKSQKRSPGGTRDHHR